MADDKTVKVRLIAVADQYVKGTREAANATQKLGSDIEGVGAKTKGLDGSAKGASGALKGMALAGAAVAGTALVSFLTDAVAAAGDLQQSIGGVDSVFGGAADKIHAFGKESAENVGLSTNAFNELVSVTGAMLKNKGLTDFADKSIELVKIGADLSATFGGTAKDAVEALNAAMRGESDPIERYGISLNETAVNAELAAKGMDKLEGAALDQAKAQARIEIIMRQSADATGAFSREADTLQGQQQRLNAEWENAQASLGQALLPALTEVVSMLRGGIDAVLATAAAFEKIPGPIKVAAGALIALHLLRGPLGSMLDGTIGKVKELGTQLRGGGIAGGAKAAGSALMGAFGGPMGIAVGIGAAALTHWWQEAQRAEQIADSLRGTIDKTTGAFTSASKATVVDALLGDLSTSDVQLLESMGISFEEFAQAALDGGPKFAEMRKQLVGMTEDAYRAHGIIGEEGRALEGFGRSVDRASEAAGRAKVIEEVTKGIESTGDAAQTTTPKLKGYEDIIGDVQKQAADAEQANKDLAAAMLAVKSAAGDADAAAIAYEAALDDATAAIKENGRTLDINTEAGRANKTALIDIATEAKNLAEANLTAGDSTDKVKKSMQEAREEFINVATKMGLSKTAAKKLADEYGLTKGTVDNLAESMDEIPKQVVSKLKVETSEATQRLKTFKLLYDSFGNKQVTLSAVYTTQGHDAAQAYRNRFATGGHVAGPGTATSDSIPAYLSDGEYVIKAAAVEKYGKGFFDRVNAMRFASGGYVQRFAQGGMAIDYDRLAGAVRSGGGIAVNVTSGNPDVAARRVVDALQWEVANGF